MQMNRWRGFVLVTAVYFSAAAFPAFGADRDCQKELVDGHAKFLKEQRAMNFKSGAASGGTKADKALIKWLKKWDAVVVKHENAHKKAAGKWGGEITYYYYTWWGKKYATSGCMHWANKGRNVPPDIALKAALAPDEPSSIDLKIAEDAKKHIKIKKSRDFCRTHNSGANIRLCLKPYAGYEWLDRVKSSN